MMVGMISAFGYSVSLTIILVIVALVIGLGLAVMFWLTVGLSVYRSVQETRRERGRDDLRDRLLDGVFDPNPDWGWVEELSRTECHALEALLNEYLRELDGQDAEKLHELGEKLGIPDRSKQQLETGGEYERLYALTWLALLNRPDLSRAAEFSPQTPRERAAVARLRHESGDLEAPDEGISILLDDTTSQFTVFGQDTLYRIALSNPAVLFSASERRYRAWTDPLLTQVLVVCQHLGTSVTTEDLSWLTSALEHENEAVRGAAARALGNVGWRSDIRKDPLLDRALRDPSPHVRGEIYQMLARWGDTEAIQTLTDALQRETNPWTRLAGTNALVDKRDRLPDRAPEALETAWDWSSEHAKYDRIARQRHKRMSD
jgi:hypothetical protein